MKLTKRFLSLALAVAIAVISNPMETLAKESVQTMEVVNTSFVDEGGNVYSGVNNIEKSSMIRGSSITTASLNVTPLSNEILITMSTVCSFTATKVGVKEVYVQEKVWYGWKTIAQAADYESNSNSFSGQAHCTNATKGKTYRVLCTHYAIESNGTEHTVANQSEEFVYN